MATNLKRCPLCGTAASVTKLNNRNGKATYNITCGIFDNETCGLVLFGGSDTRKAMIKKWNRRTEVSDDD